MQPTLKCLLIAEIQYNSIGLINTQYRPSVVCQHSSARLYFSQVQRVFTVENCLASRSYLTCHNVFRDTFHDSPVPNKSIVPR
jgi:hypothetical protein